MVAKDVVAILPELLRSRIEKETGLASRETGRSAAQVILETGLIPHRANHEACDDACRKLGVTSVYAIQLDSPARSVSANSRY